MSSPSRPASQALIMVPTSFLRISLPNAVSCALLSTIGFAQEKADSTQFKFWYSEINKIQKQLRSADSLRIKLAGIFEYQYEKLIEEKRKIDANKEKK